MFLPHRSHAEEVQDPGDQPNRELPVPAATRARSTLPKLGEITFDPHGDIILVISCDNDPSAVARFQVNSVVLCLASPVFLAMLGPHSPFKERSNLQLATIGGRGGQGATPMELPLTDDDPEAFAVILRILHLQFCKIPVAMSASGDDEASYKLYEMAIICDKYDMRDVLLYWLETWTQPRFDKLRFKDITMSTAMGSRWLFIAYAFGYSRLFNLVSKELILHCRVESLGEILLPSDEHGSLNTYYLPQSVIDEILAKRQQAIESMIDAVHNEIERYSNPETNLCKFNEPCCDAMMLGLLSRAFRKLKVYPEASAVAIRSVEEVNSILRGVEFPTFIPTTKPTGCCNNPLRSQPIQHGGLFGTTMYHPPNNFAFEAFGTSPEIHNDSTCANCQNKYQALQGVNVNHAEHCLPSTQLKKNLDDILVGVTGLKYSQFVRNGGRGHVKAGGQAIEGLVGGAEYSEIL